jgi:hypothetical protein
VVEEHKGYCNVVTINSYGDRSLDKRATDASEHAVVWTELDQSHLSKDESSRAKQMLQGSIRIIPDWIGDKRSFLRPGSVLDFGKVMPVQHYHEAELFGFVADECLDTLRRHYNNMRSKSTAPKSNIVAPAQIQRPYSNDVLNISSKMDLSASSGDGSWQMMAPPKLVRDEACLSCLVGGEIAEIHKYISNSVGTEEERDDSKSDLLFHKDCLLT